MKSLYVTYLNLVRVCIVIGLLVTAGSNFSCKSKSKEDEDSKTIKDDALTKETKDTKPEIAKGRETKSPKKEKAKLEFRVVPSQQELTDAGVHVGQIIEKLEQEGPVNASTDEYVWQKIRNPRDPDNPDQRGGFPETNQDRIPLVIGTYLGTKYVLASNKPEETMLHETGPGAWKLRNSRPDTDRWNKPALGFRFNEAGTKRFWDLTKAHKNKNLGIFIDDVAISAPNINTPIFQSGIITGDFSPDEVQDMVDRLNAGTKTDAKKGNWLFNLFK